MISARFGRLGKFYATLTGLPVPPRISGSDGAAIMRQIYERLSLISLSESEYISTLEMSPTVVGNTIYDALIARCAVKAGATTILTWNVRHFVRLGPMSPGFSKHQTSFEPFHNRGNNLDSSRVSTRDAHCKTACQMSAVFRAVNLSKTFGRVPVLNALDFEVPQGSVFGLIGPNGAGKTTTIKIMMNILQPTSGHVEVLGVDSRRLAPDDLTKIGYVSENQEMPGWMTVRYLLDYLKPFYPTWDDARATELVRQFDLPLNRELNKSLARHVDEGGAGVVARLSPAPAGAR